MGNRWLFKTEPSTYSWDDLVRDGRTVWDGVTNPLALKHLRQAKEGDTVIVYHTGNVKAAIGLAKVVRDAYIDPKRKGSKLAVVDLVPEKPLPKPVTLAEMRLNRALEGFDLLRLGRLSIVPVSEAHWGAIMTMAGR